MSFLLWAFLSWLSLLTTICTVLAIGAFIDSLHQRRARNFPSAKLTVQPHEKVWNVVLFHQPYAIPNGTELPVSSLKGMQSISVQHSGSIQTSRFCGI